MTGHNWFNHSSRLQTRGYIAFNNFYFFLVEVVKFIDQFVNLLFVEFNFCLFFLIFQVIVRLSKGENLLN